MYARVLINDDLLFICNGLRKFAKYVKIQSFDLSCHILQNQIKKTKTMGSVFTKSNLDDLSKKHMENKNSPISRTVGDFFQKKMLHGIHL